VDWIKGKSKKRKEIRMVSWDWFLIGMLFIVTIGVLITALEFVSKDKE